MNGAALALLAHQGGWDEILLVLGPILAIGGLLVLARKRAERGDLNPGGTSVGRGVADLADDDALDVGTNRSESTD